MTINRSAKKGLTILGLMIPFISLFLISKLFLSDIYLFEWTARHHYLFLWVAVILLVLIDRVHLATALTIGNVVGVLVGQFLGDLIRNQSLSQITPEMSGEEVYRLSHHPGFEIWLATIGVCFLVVVVKNIFWRFGKKL